jgi:replicative DNA helicase
MERFAARAAEGLEANIGRWLRFQGLAAGQAIELQALKVPDGKYISNRVAYAFDETTVVRLLAEADKWGAPAVYVILNQVDDAVATRIPPGRWMPAQKGEATTDADIAKRLVLYLDFDPRRPRGTSATDQQVARALATAELARRRLLQVVNESSIAMGMSGNGASLFIAIEPTVESDSLMALVRGILAAAGVLFSDDEIEVDASVCDAKRLGPAWGTHKRKGAPGVAERPHRRTGFTCADKVTRESVSALEMLLANLRLDFTDEQNAAVDKAMGKKAAPAQKTASTSGASAQQDQDSPFTKANTCDAREVAQRLGLIDGDAVKCPGCGTAGDSSVAFVKNGLKCSHNRCADKGVRKGFRTPVDLVMEVNGVSNIEAVRWLGDAFGFEVPKGKTEPKDDPRSAGSSGEWEQPLPFTDQDLPPFPVEALPPAIADFVRAESEATQTPPDLAGMLSLAAFAAAASKAVVVHVKDGYTEPTNLYVGVVLPPGERKSKVQRDVIEAMLAWERAAADAAAEKIRHAVQRFKISEKRLEAAEARAARATGRDERERAELEARQAADDHDAIKIPVAPRLVADDATPEALISLLAQHRRIAQFSAEGGVFSMLAGGRYSQNVNLDPWLKGHTGSEPIRVDRKGRPPEHIDNPTLTVAVAMQPHVLDTFAESPMLRGVGLLARFLYSMPKSRMGSRNVDPEPMPAAVRERYAKALTAVLSLDPEKTITLKLSPEALAAYHDFARWVEPQLAEFGDLGMVRDWGSKLSGAICRISGICALVSLSNDLLSSLTIGLEDFERAVAIGRYLVPHAKAAFGAMGADAKLEGAKQVWRCIERNGWKSVSRKDLQQALKGSKRFEHADALDQPLAVLEERGYLRKTEERTGKAGRPKTVYEVNPLCTNSFNPTNGGEQ